MSERSLSQTDKVRTGMLYLLKNDIDTQSLGVMYIKNGAINRNLARLVLFFLVKKKEKINEYFYMLAKQHVKNILKHQFDCPCCRK
jgi:hypothetical protein